VIGVFVSTSRVVCALGFPHKNAVFDIHIPGAGTGAVNAVSGADFFVILPTTAIEIFPFTLSTTDLGPFLSDLFLTTAIFFPTWSKKSKR
jgi:hypothetical protein